jgi:hypothetical protein
MKGKRVFNSLTGEWEDETQGYQNVIYQTFHGTGSADPRMHDPDFLAGRQKYTARRTVITLSIAVETAAYLEEMAEITGMNRGRLADAIVKAARDYLTKRTEGGNGEAEGADADELGEARASRRRRSAHD